MASQCADVLLGNYPLTHRFMVIIIIIIIIVGSLLTFSVSSVEYSSCSLFCRSRSSTSSSATNCFLRTATISHRSQTLQISGLHCNNVPIGRRTIRLLFHNLPLNLGLLWQVLSHPHNSDKTNIRQRQKQFFVLS